MWVLVWIQISSLTVGPTIAMANPLGGSVVEGSAAINQAGATTTINQFSQRAIVDWNSFSIGAGELTQFNQPNANAAILNRVTGADPSALLGTMNANGQVFLINPHGILVGPNATINVSSFVGSTLNVANQEFMRGGDMNFQGDSRAAVENNGAIRAIEGDIYLIGGHVANHGRLIAPNGNVGLAAGQDVMLVDAAHPRLKVRPTGASLGGIGVLNNGTIEAAQAQLAAAHGNVYALAINTTGAIRANQVVKTDGKILLTAPGGTILGGGEMIAEGGDITIDSGVGGATEVTGNLDVSGETGGNVTILGDEIRLAGANINASGLGGGGLVRIGGDYQGGGDLAHAQTVNIDAESTIFADANEQGDGGQVIVWSDNATDMLGSIYARGGPAGGDGGFAEVSSVESLNFQGIVNLSGPVGDNGLLLLDPMCSSAMVINASQAAAIEENLENQDVVISHGCGVNLTADLSWAGDNSLTLSGGEQVYFLPGVTLSHTAGSGNLVLETRNYGAPYFYPGSNIDFTGSSGDVTILYNPTGGNYANAIDYSPFVTMGTTGSLNAMMLVHNVNQLQAINTNLSGAYALANDIDASATATWKWDGAKYAGFEPIGDNSTLSAASQFTGTFDGRGYVIQDLTINRPTTDYVGLFGYSRGSTIQNVGLVNADVTGRGGVGALVGVDSFSATINNAYATGAVQGESSVGGLVGSLGYSSTISNSYATSTVQGSGDYAGGLVGYNNHNSIVNNSYATGDVNGDTDSVGGLIGKNDSSSLSNSYATGNVTGGGYYVGGLSGYNHSTPITNCYATGDVTGYAYVGGLAGHYRNQTINNCYAKGNVTGTAENVGGLVGWHYYGTILGSFAGGAVTSAGNKVGGLIGESYHGVASRCYASGSVTGNDEVGGLIGLAQEYGGNELSYAAGNVTGRNYVGGLVGRNYYHTYIMNSYATGNVTGEYSVGGLVGYNYLYANIYDTYCSGEVTGNSYVGAFIGRRASTYSTIRNSFYDTTVNPALPHAAEGYSTGIYGRTTAQLMQQSTYSGWNFPNFWYMIEGNTRPFLRTEHGTTIRNAHQLQLMALNLSADYSLANDIDMAELRNPSGLWNTSTGFDPVGDAYHRFTGSFDGQGHVIDGLYVNRPSEHDAGLFGYAENVSFANVGLSNADITGNYNVGPLAGMARLTSAINNCYTTGKSTGANSVGGLVGQLANGAIVQNSYAEALVEGLDGVGGLVGNSYSSGGVSSSYATGNVRGHDYVGGLVGRNSSPLITDCYATGTVSGRDSVGGLVGYNYVGTITGSYATGNVMCRHKVGGLVGLGDNLTLSNSYATGNVEASGGEVGGLVGSLQNSGVENSYAAGAVSGLDEVGGLVGYSRYSEISKSYSTGDVTGTDDFVGGFVGMNYRTTISDCYAWGDVSGDGSTGGFAGMISSPQGNTVTNCYAIGKVSNKDTVYGDTGGFAGENDGGVSNCFWDIQTSGTTVGVGYGETTGITGMPTMEMKRPANFTSATGPNGGVNPNWNFGDPGVWHMVEGLTYPLLHGLNQLPAYETLGGTVNLNPGQPWPGETVALAIDGTALFTTVSDANGQYSFNVRPGQLNDTAVLVYLDDGTHLGASGYHAQGSSLSDFDILAMYLTARSNGPMSNELFGQAKGSLTDSDIPYSVRATGGKHDLTLTDGIGFFLPTSNLYNLDGNLTGSGNSYFEFEGNATPIAPATVTAGANLSVKGGIDYDSSEPLNLLSEGSVQIFANVQNHGDGDITVISNWDPDTQTYGDGFGHVEVGHPAFAAASVGSRRGTTTVQGRNVYLSDDAQIGFAGDGDVMDGPIHVNATDYVILRAWQNDSITQIGHRRMDNEYGDTIDAPIHVTAGGQVQLYANDTYDYGVDNATAQIGHRLGRYYPADAAIIKGNVTIEAIDGVSLAARYIQSQARIGHSALANDSEISGTIEVTCDDGGVNLDAGYSSGAFVGHERPHDGGSLSGDVWFDVDRGLSLNATSESAAQIGHGGPYGGYENLCMASGEVGIEVGSDEGGRSLYMSATQDSESRIGHGGYAYRGHLGEEGQQVSIEATGTVEMLSSDYSLTQIGHGGVELQGSSPAEIYGDIYVATDEQFRMESQEGGMTQVGHGGPFAEAIIDGGITVRSGDDHFFAYPDGYHEYAHGLELTATGDLAFTQIGHGGVGFQGNAYGDIDVETAGTALLMASTENEMNELPNMVQVGHGGYLSEAYTDSFIGEITFTAGDDFEAVYEAGQGNPHLLAIPGLSMICYSNMGTVQIGHGGPGSYGYKSGNVAVSTEGAAQLFVSLYGFDQEELPWGATVQIGHGGGVSFEEDIAYGPAEGDVSLTTGDDYYRSIENNGSSSVYQFLGLEMRSQGDYTYVHVGHGGLGYEGDLYGSVTVETEGAAHLYASSSLDWNSEDYTSGATVQVGHGGLDACADDNTWLGDITFTSGGNIIRERDLYGPDFTPGLEIAAIGDRSTSQIGHGGRWSQGAADGAIDVTSQGALVLHANSNNYYEPTEEAEATAQIGHGGFEGYGSAEGPVTVASGDGFVWCEPNWEESYFTYSFTAGLDVEASGYKDTAQIGHGGFDYVAYELRGPSLVGTIDVDTAGPAVITASSYWDSYYESLIGGRANAQVGHGGRRAEAIVAGDIYLNSGPGLPYNEENWGYLDTPNQGLYLSASGDKNLSQVGHGGFGFAGDVIGYIRVETEGTLALNAWADDNGDDVFGGGTSQIGHGGPHSYSGLTTYYGDIDVYSGRDTAVQTWWSGYYGYPSGSLQRNPGLKLRASGQLATTQIGHGGRGSVASAVGDIYIETQGTVDIQAYAYDEGGIAHSNPTSQIGHGGSRSNAENPRRTLSGYVELYSGEDFLQTYLDQYPDPDNPGEYIRFETNRYAPGLTMQADGEGSTAHIGHGGRRSQASADGGIWIETKGTTRLDAESTGEEENATLVHIGHGGVRAGSVKKTQFEGNLGLVTGEDHSYLTSYYYDGQLHADILSTSYGLNARAYGDTGFVNIGHGGPMAKGQANGHMLVRTAGSAHLTSMNSYYGSQYGGVVQFGHGGASARMNATGLIGMLVGNLERGGSLIMRAYDPGGAVQIGHGGPNFVGNSTGRGKLGSILNSMIVGVTDEVVMDVRAEGSYALIGHGTTCEEPGDFAGHMALIAGKSISMNVFDAADHDRTFAQIGHRPAFADYKWTLKRSLIKGSHLIVAYGQRNPFEHQGYGLSLREGSTITAGSPRHAVAVFGPSRDANWIEDGAPINGVPFDGSLASPSINGAWNWAPNGENWGHELWDGYWLGNLAWVGQYAPPFTFFYFEPGIPPVDPNDVDRITRQQTYDRFQVFPHGPGNGNYGITYGYGQPRPEGEIAGLSSFEVYGGGQ
jgi:filamentous hemagglutinin family protein